MDELSVRVAKLEKSNRRMRLAVMVMGAGMFAVVLMGAAAKKSIEAERFAFRDASGKERLVLDTTSAGPTCTLTDINGKPSVKVIINKDGYFQMQQNPIQAPAAK